VHDHRDFDAIGLRKRTGAARIRCTPFSLFGSRSRVPAGCSAEKFQFVPGVYACKALC
jgi:hypothetical protein